MSFKGFSIFSSDVHFCSAERTDFSNVGRRSPIGHFCEIISKSFHKTRRICRFKVFLFLALAANLFIGAERF